MAVAVEFSASAYANTRAIHEAILWVDVTRSIGESLDDRESADEDNDSEEGGKGEEGEEGEGGGATAAFSLVVREQILHQQALALSLMLPVGKGERQKS